MIQSIAIDLSVKLAAKLFGYATIAIPFNLKAKITAAKTACVRRVKQIDDWFELNGIEKQKEIILYKRVSSDFKTQEGTENETEWKIGSTLIHPSYQPETDECGKGKFHACSRPYFCDEFRDAPKDRYIALAVKLSDTYAWPKPQYPHKIGFGRGKVLYECDRFGEKIGEKK